MTLPFRGPHCVTRSRGVPQPSCTTNHSPLCVNSLRLGCLASTPTQRLWKSIHLSSAAGTCREKPWFSLDSAVPTHYLHRSSPPASMPRPPQSSPVACFHLALVSLTRNSFAAWLPIFWLHRHNTQCLSIPRNNENVLWGPLKILPLLPAPIRMIHLILTTSSKNSYLMQHLIK